MVERPIRISGAVFAIALLAAVAAFAGNDGYLDATREPIASDFLTPPPAPGSAALAEDESVFLRTRALKDSERWALAAHDDDSGPVPLLEDFTCALGMRLDASNAPHLMALLQRARGDAGVVSVAAKNFFRRSRPLVGNTRPICVARTGYETSFAYPSGHATMGWMYALILSELVPDRTSRIAARGRSYGESRVVCGVHWESDVEAGRTMASVLVAALHGDAAFRADLDAARAEIAQARPAAAQGDPAICRIQDAASIGPW
jgi:acid phosphatase (class A)